MSALTPSTIRKRAINRLKQHRRIATRYEKRADTFAAFLALVAIRCWL